MNIQKVEVDTAGIYCINFLSSGDVLLTGSYTQGQCVQSTTIPNGNNKYEVSFIIPNGNYTIPKIRVFKSSLNGASRDFVNINVQCTPTTTVGGGGGGGGVNYQINNLLWQPDVNDDNFLKLQIVPLETGFVKLVDIGSNQNLKVYYKINGASNPIDAQLLSQNPIPVNEEVQVIKYGYDASIGNLNDPNQEAWRIYFDENNPLPAKIASLTFNVYYNIT